MAHDGYTGHLFEEEVFGRCKAVHKGYMQWREAAEVVRKNQPARMAEKAAKLQAEVRKQIGSAAVQFYTAVRSTLDQKHGVDGFFELVGTIVTVDLTMNDKKDCCKADLLVVPEELEDLRVLAGRIAREILSKQRRRRAA